MKQEVKEKEKLFKALADSTRIKIINILMKKTSNIIQSIFSFTILYFQVKRIMLLLLSQ